MTATKDYVLALSVVDEEVQHCCHKLIIVIRHDGSKTVNRTFHFVYQFFLVASHICNGEEWLGLCKTEHEASNAAVAQWDVVTDTASQQASNVNVKVDHNTPALGLAELLEVDRYFIPQSVRSLDTTLLPELKKILVDLLQQMLSEVFGCGKRWAC